VGEGREKKREYRERRRGRRRRRRSGKKSSRRERSADDEAAAVPFSALFLCLEWASWKWKTPCLSWLLRLRMRKVVRREGGGGGGGGEKEGDQGEHAIATSVSLIARQNLMEGEPLQMLNLIIALNCE